MRVAFWALALAALMILSTAVIAPSETRVLPAGTLISTPDGKVITLTADHFLFDRPAAEAAANALEGRKVDAKTILDLKTLSDGQQVKINNNSTWRTVIGIGAFALGVFVDEVVRK